VPQNTVHSHHLHARQRSNGAKPVPTPRPPAPLQVKAVNGSSILRILKTQGLAPDIPEDLYHLIKKVRALLCAFAISL
jgi:hypothetical protein